MLQAGRIVNVHLPKDRVSQTHQGYGFVEFKSEEDADYAAKIMNQVRVLGKPIRVNKASADKQKTVEVGAELFVGNLDPMVDEKILFDTFSRFGSLISAPKVRILLCKVFTPLLKTTQVARDDANLSKGYGFVSFSNFEASDEAIANMNGQFLMNKEITVQYAYKKDGKGERHGDQAERMLAAQARKHNVQPNIAPLPPQLFAPPPTIPSSVILNGDARGPAGAQGPPAGFNPPAGFGPPGGSYAGVPPPHQQRPLAAPLPPPPSGLPARPPPSQAGYGGPAGFVPPGFNPAPPAGFAPPAGVPPGFGAPPGFGPPPGFGAPPPQGVPPGMPPGFQQPQQGFGRR